nr:MAG TPA: zinc finger domain protein [Caudoviricetes sp.]
MFCPFCPCYICTKSVMFFVSIKIVNVLLFS